ncbi:hypothetical protein MW290_31250 [Aquincola tertiaricarbonis]|uniref:Transcriptional regulator n=1 Tax=Aquincola tertiaricarbonis TaxID=391953 RepID=A0ABY4S9H3_AQUTE|nr:PhaM family polyhydroxyalkanoate granule multifunctional regulatory protein [Aquincola tertiaricarbonis]URI10013.1 hypothetical protein MW290_31250 [Aquincola tertiaricarbonis]
MADSASPFSSLVPGFDFLQNLVKGAGSAMPSIGQWVAPTLDPAELTKRIDELKTVQFWLEQNARMLAATIQALEVQRMTLSTLKTMNVQVQDLQEAMKIKLPEAPAPAAKAAATAAEGEAAEPAAKPAGVVDPMQWWGALTKQFTELAAEAIKEGSAQAAQVAQLAKMPSPLQAATATPAATPSASAKAGATAAAAPARKAAAKKAARKRPSAG